MDVWRAFLVSYRGLQQHHLPHTLASLQRHNGLHYQSAARRLSLCSAANHQRSLSSGSQVQDTVKRQLPSVAEVGRVDTAPASAVRLPQYCSGCGVKLQSWDASQPGFARIPKHLLETPEPIEASSFAEEDDWADLADSAPQPTLAANSQSAETASWANDPVDPDDELKRRAVDRMIESWADDDRKKPEPRHLIIDEPVDDGTPSIVCVRCFSLSHYGRVKEAAAEAELPVFDLVGKVGRKISFQRNRTAVILCVVDMVDFDGSLPIEAIQALIPESQRPPPASFSGSQAAGSVRWSFVVAANKADLLPAQATAQRLQAWARHRLGQAGLPRPASVHLVSSIKNSGVKDLLGSLHDEVNGHGDVWVVGAQNAGKSSLINAMHRAAHRSPSKKPLTIASVPGTTLGVLRVDGLMPPRCRMFDTPGVPHRHQLASLLTAEEVALLLPKRRLQPRTYRIGAGHTLLVGGVARFDVMQIPGATVYLTAFASGAIACHLSKTENVGERYQRLAGRELAPPGGDVDRLQRWPGLLPCEVSVEGNSWKRSSTDVSIAGLGWVAIGVSGMAHLRVWAPPGIAVTTRPALIPDFNAQLERPGLGMRDKPKVGKQLLQGP